MIYAASILINLGAKNVFIKGGHLNSKIVQDIFINKNEIMILKNKELQLTIHMELVVLYLLLFLHSFHVEKP